MAKYDAIISRDKGHTNPWVPAKDEKGSEAIMCMLCKQIGKPDDKAIHQGNCHKGTDKKLDL